MPFKSGKSINDINRRVENHIDETIQKRIQRELYSLMFDIGNYADFLVPKDTLNLINSREHKLTKTNFGWRGTVGYYTGYAGILHSPKPGGKMDGWKPKPVPSPGKQTGAFNADARQDWFNVTWAQYGSELLDNFKRGITK
jgi:hypothetical protein